MGLFKKPLKKTNTEAITAPTAHDYAIGNRSETEEEPDSYELPSSNVGGNPPPKRRNQHAGGNEDDEETENSRPPTKAKPPPKVNAQPAGREFVYLSTDISRDLHTRLRIYSLKTGKTLGALIEEMISKHCPE